MTEQDKERIFEKYCKLEEAFRIAKDALRLIQYTPDDDAIKSKPFAMAILTRIDEVFIESGYKEFLNVGPLVSEDGTVYLLNSENGVNFDGKQNKSLSDLEREIEKLKEQNIIFREALEFYADGDNWGHIEPGTHYATNVYQCVDKTDYGEGDFTICERMNVDDCGVGGKRARQALKQYEESK